MIRRRALLAAPAVVPGLARAQVRSATRRIGYLHSVSTAPGNASLQVLRPQWARLGYVEGETVLLRAPEGDRSRLPALVADLVAQQVRVIIVVGAPALRAAVAHAGNVPIVAIDLETNPVTAGFARSYARPGGMVTGLFLDQPSLAAKWIELLHETVPGTEHACLIWDEGTGRDLLDAAQSQASGRGLRTTVIPVHPVQAVEAALLPFEGTRTSLLALPTPGFTAIAGLLGATARRRQLPMLSFVRSPPGSGILMGYGPDQFAHFARAMAFVERILAGQAPGDLPIELPTRFLLTLDLGAARALGITFPTVLLAQADEVHE